MVDMGCCCGHGPSDKVGRPECRAIAVRGVILALMTDCLAAKGSVAFLDWLAKRGLFKSFADLVNLRAKGVAG
jgi:hypothetical protein